MPILPHTEGALASTEGLRSTLQNPKQLAISAGNASLTHSYTEESMPDMQQVLLSYALSLQDGQGVKLQMAPVEVPSQRRPKRNLMRHTCAKPTISLSSIAFQSSGC